MYKFLLKSKKLIFFILIVNPIFLYNITFAQEIFKHRVYPILLVHGITGNFQGWIEDGNIPDALGPYYTLYSDRNVRYRSQGWRPYERLNLDYNVFGISYSETCGPIENNATELDRAINGYNGKDGIRQIMSKAYPEVFPSPDDVEIVIIAHSMGGLSSRKYIQDHSSNHYIAKLITLGTLHQGTFAADEGHAWSIMMNCWGQGSAYLFMGATFTAVPGLQWLGALFLGAGFFILEKGGEVQEQLSSGLLQTDGAKEMIPTSSFLQTLNSSIPSNLAYRLIGGKGEWTKNSFLVGVLYGAGIGSEATDGDGFVPIASALAIPGLNINPVYPFAGVSTLKNAPNYTITACHNKPLADKYGGSTLFQEFGKNNFFLRILEDPPVISNLSLFASDSKPLANNALQDINKHEIIVTGNLWDYLLNKLDAKISFSHKLPQSIDFDTFGGFVETATLPVGGKNTLSVSASNLANYYSSSAPQNIYLVGISYPRDGMILTPESSSQFQYSVLGSIGEVITTEVQSLSFGDYGGALPERIIDLPSNAYRLSKPQCLNGEMNSDIIFLNENNNSLLLDESSRYIVEGMTRFKARLNNNFEGKTFVKLQGNADAAQWSGYEIQGLGYRGEGAGIWKTLWNSTDKVPGPAYGTLHNWETTRANGPYQIKCRISGQEANSATYYLGTQAPGTGDYGTTEAFDPYRKVGLWFGPEALKVGDYITISAMNRTVTIQTPNPLFKPVGHIYEIKPELTPTDFNTFPLLKFKYTQEDIDFDITGDG